MADFKQLRQDVVDLIKLGAPDEEVDAYIGSRGFSPDEFKLANENYGTFMSAVKRGGKNIGSLVGDFLPAMGADLFEKIAPDSFKPQIEAFKQRQLEEAAKTQEEIAKTLPAKYGSYEEVGSPLEALGYAKEAIGEAIPSFLPGVVTGGVGSIVSRGAVAAAGQAASQAAKNRVLASAPAAALESGAAEQLAAKAAISAASKAMTSKALQYEAAGAVLGSSALTIPDAYSTIYSETGKTELLPAIGGGLFNAGLDAITPISLLRAARGKGLTNQDIIGAWYMRGIRGAAKGAVTEGLTEGLQEVTNAAAVKFVDENKEIFTPENFVRFIDSSIRGALGGAAVTGAAGAAFGKEKATPKQEESTQFIPPPGAVPVGQGTGLGVSPAPFSPLTGERDLAGAVPRGAFYKPTEELEPIIGPDGKVTGYKPAKQVPPRAELEGEQLELPVEPSAFPTPAQGELFPGEVQGELPVSQQQPFRKSELRNIEGELIYPEELKNVKGEPLAPDADLAKPIDEYIKGIVEKAKKDTSASKLLKANNPATAKIVADRIQALLSSPEADPTEAMEQLYEQDKTGRYPAGTKALSEAQRELLQTIYRRRTGRDIEDTIRDRAFAKAQQGELFPEGDVDGTKQGAGQGELFPGAAGANVGVAGEGPGADLFGQPTGGAAGAPGVGVGGGELPPAGGVGGVGTKPSALTPEEAWNRHKNDDHPAFNELGPEEQAAWSDLVARGRDTAPNFQDIVEEHAKKSKRTPEQIEKALIGEYKPAMAQDIEKELAGKTFDQVLTFLANNGPEANREIAKKMQQRVKELRQVGYTFKFKLAQTPDDVRTIGGYTDDYGRINPGILGRVLAPGRSKTIDISVAGRNSGQVFGGTYRTMTHEALHAVTSALIIYGEANPKTEAGKIAKELKNISKYVLDYLTNKERSVGLNARERKVLHETNALGNETSNGGRYNQAHEMISHGMTTPELMEVLETIPYSKTQSVGSYFVELFRKLLGLAPKYESALSEVIRLSQEIIEAPAASLQTATLKGARLRATEATNFEEPVTFTSSTATPPPAAPPGPSVVPAPGQPYTLPKLTKLQPAPTVKQSVVDTTKKITDAYNDSDWWTKFRIAAVDPTSGLAKTLSSLPAFQNGKLRGDMLIRSFSQVINLIKNGIQSGIPVVNSDGTVVIQRDANNLARSQIIADELNNNAIVKGSGLSGRGYVAEIARILRGDEIMKVDAHRRFKAGMAFQEAERKMQEAKRLRAGGGSLTQILQLVNEAKALRKHYRKDLNANREKQVTQAHIDWANQQLKAVPQAQEILNIWGEVNQGLIALWENTGLLTPEQAAYYRSMKNYVPLYAAREDLPTAEQEAYTGARTGTKTVRELDHLEGTDLQRNIWENIDKHYASMTAAAFQNQTRKVAADQLLYLKAARVAKDSNDPNINLRYRDPTNPLADKHGVMHMILDNPNDLAAFQTMHYTLGPLMKGISATTQVLRGTALINPMYWIRQLIRDPIQASLVANSGIVTPFHSAAEYMRVLAGQSEEAKLLASRGVIGQIDSTIDLQDFLKQVGTEKVSPSKLDEMIRKVMRMHEASDAATRVALFKKARDEGLRKGMSAKEAEDYGVFKARESINFGVRGNSQTLNTLRHMIPFFSATIVSLDTLYRAATGYGLNPQEKAEAQRIFYSRALMMAVMSTAYAMMLQDDEDYKKLPDNVKDNNWLLPSPVGDERSFIKIAIPYEVGFLFKTLPEAFVRYAAGTSTGKETFASIGLGIKRNLPGEGILIPQAFKPALESVTNYSFFTGRPIEGMSDKGLPVEFRGPHASELAKTLSSYGLNKIELSPAKIDALIQGYFAELGTFSTGMASAAINAATGKEPPAKNLEQMPFFKAFLTNPNTSKAATDYYEISSNAQEAVNAFNRMKKEGRIEEAKEFISKEENKKLIAAAPALRKIQDQMAAIRSQINVIERNERIDPETRRQKINELMGIYDRVARQGYKVAEAAGIER
jgi:hypothetical protein